MVSDLADLVVRGTHETSYASIVGIVEHPNDRLGIPETHLLRSSLFFGHVVDTKELVITE